jgi:hypothetical protein
MTDEKILKRIERLLAMSKDASSPNEAAIAARRAEALMREHNLNEADVILKEMTDDDIVDIESSTGYSTIPHWMMRLTVPVAKLMDCEVRAYVYNREKRVTYLGQKEDAQVAAWIFEYLVDQVKRLSKKYRAEQRKKFGAGHGTNMGDYREGVVISILATIAEMIAEKETQLKEHTTGTALVVRKKDLIEQKFGETKYGNNKGRSMSDADAYHRGREDGNNVRINPAVSTDQAREQIR